MLVPSNFTVVIERIFPSLFSSDWQEDEIE